MGLLVLITALIETIIDTIKGRDNNYWEYDYDNYHNLCTMLEEQEDDEDDNDWYYNNEMRWNA